MGRGRRIRTWTVVALAGVLGLAPTLAAQTAADSLSVYRYVVAGSVGEAGFLTHPAGRAEAACVEGTTLEGRAPAPGHVAFVSELIAEVADVVLSRDCEMVEASGEYRHRWVEDEAGRPAVQVRVSGVVFRSPDTAVVRLGIHAGALWGWDCTTTLIRIPSEPDWDTEAKRCMVSQ